MDKETTMATQTFEEASFRFVAGDECTLNGQRGREWIAQHRAAPVGGCCWIRAMAAHMPLLATRKEIVEEFDILGLFG